jgi:predicted Zn-dependent protease with MMP-like domain
MPEQEPAEEAYADDGTQIKEEEEPARHKSENIPRSSFFFASLSFLIAFICLSILLSRYLDFILYLLLLCGVIVFGTVGILFLRQNSLLNRTAYAQMDNESDEEAQALLSLQEEKDEVTDEAAQGSFERLVEEALIAIPAEFQEKMENMVILVENEPPKEVLQRMETKEGYTLFGLYEGVPLTTQSHAGAMRPEVITIFQGPIERYCHRDPDRIREQVRRTVLHEVAHHFGIDHDEMPIWIK